MEEPRDAAEVDAPESAGAQRSSDAGTGAQSYGWAGMGQRLLTEYGADADGKAASWGQAPTERFSKTWREIRGMASMKMLAPLAVGQMCLLHAVDNFPRGGLCQGPQLKESLRRYERLWLPLLADAAASSNSGSGSGYGSLVPPLDVAFLWHLHRLQPEAYAADCGELKGRDGRRAPVLHVGPQQAFAFSDGHDAAGASAAALWRKAYPSEPFYPPAPPGSQTDAFRTRLSADLAAVAVRVPLFLHQLLRGAYMQLPFLNRAVDRYCRFLLIKKHHLELQHPIPPLDVALIWSSHMSLSGAYAADCQQLLQRPFLDLPGAGASLWLERDTTGPWRFHWSDTQRAWAQEFEDPFVVPGSGYVPMDSTHPAEAALGQQLLAAYEEGGSTRDAAWRAGAHALYLSWLRNPNLRQQQQQQQQPPEATAAKPAAPAQQPPQQPRPQQQPQQQAPKPKSKGGGLFACFGCGAASAADEERVPAPAAPPPPPPAPPAPSQPVLLPLLSDAELARIASGFRSFQNLPHSSSHPYWRQLTPRGPNTSADSPGQPGAEVEVFMEGGSSSGAANGISSHGSSSRRGDTRGGPGDQQGGAVSGEYEVAVAGGQALMWQ